MRYLYVLLFMFLPTLSWGATYYVDNTGGANTNSGFTEALAWETTQHACSTLVAGDTAFIRAGTYDENSRSTGQGWGLACQVGMVPLNSGTSGNTIVFKGYPGDALPIIIGKNDEVDGSGINRSAANFNSHGQAYITYDSLEFRHGFGGFYLQGHRRINNITIKYCTIDSTTGCSWDDNNGGILCYPGGGDDVPDGVYKIIVQNCEIFANGSYTSYRMGFNTGGIHSYFCDTCEFSDNVIHDEEVGIAFKGTARYTNVFNNTIYNCAEAAMRDVWGRCGDCTDQSGTRWHHNTVYDCALAYAVGYGSLSTGEFDSCTYFYNNTLDLTNSSAWADSIGQPMVGGVHSQLGYFRNSYFFNNIIYNPPTHVYSAADDHDGAFFFPNSYAPCLTIYMDYNMIFGQGDTDYFNWSGTDYTLTEWRAATLTGGVLGGSGTGTIGEQGDNSLIDDPLFTSAGTNDYTLQAGSPAASGGKGGQFIFWPSTKADTVTLPIYFGAENPGGVSGSFLDTNNVDITVRATFSGFTNVDTIWFFMDTDGTIAGADSGGITADVVTPTDSVMAGLTPATAYDFWTVVSHDGGRDTSAVFEVTTLNTVVHSVTFTDTTTTTVDVTNNYTANTVDTIWCWYDTDNNIAGADSVMETTSITDPDTIQITGLTANSLYYFWWGLHDQLGRDTASVVSVTTDAVASPGLLILNDKVTVSGTATITAGP